MIKFLIDHFDWIGATASLTGYFLMAKHRKKAIIVLIFTNILWGTLAYFNHVSSLLFLNVCYFILNLRTTVIWRREKDAVVENITAPEPIENNTNTYLI